eukprot:TRINITY_DN77660_c0_g1_i1.p1 TRINITY_DN77660_c0_g1~~TRINITY_DN77660_c0_g1_i1.p1  ORF type:complete len:208 (-),score=18.12 TRINITY_DN77660_c0_g1_i1:43-666(-)
MSYLTECALANRQPLQVHRKCLWAFARQESPADSIPDRNIEGCDEPSHVEISMSDESIDAGEEEDTVSMGSMTHKEGQCRPCFFHGMKLLGHGPGCFGGSECEFCHRCCPKNYGESALTKIQTVRLLHGSESQHEKLMETSFLERQAKDSSRLPSVRSLCMVAVATCNALSSSWMCPRQNTPGEQTSTDASASRGAQNGGRIGILTK